MSFVSHSHRLFSCNSYPGCSLCTGRPRTRCDCTIWTSCDYIPQRARRDRIAAWSSTFAVQPARCASANPFFGARRFGSRVIVLRARSWRGHLNWMGLYFARISSDEPVVIDGKNSQLTIVSPKSLPRSRI